VQGCLECAAVATAETHYPSPHYAHIPCWVSINVQQTLMNVNGCNFFRKVEFDDTSLLCTHFHVKWHSAKLLLCCYLSHGNRTYKLLDGKCNLYCHTSSICLWHCGTHTKIEAITFGVGHLATLDGYGAMLQARRSWVGVLIRSLDLFSLPNPSSRTMALGFTQPLTEISTRRSFWG
jgi:hypothetical protein